MVGLKNQGATCYLNSLLQSLYFTNSFRRVRRFAVQCDWPCPAPISSWGGLSTPVPSNILRADLGLTAY